MRRIIQIGNAGNQFKHMSVDDQGLYGFAVECLRHGKKVKVFYTEKSFLQVGLEDTDYLVNKIELTNDI